MKRKLMFLLVILLLAVTACGTADGSDSNTKFETETESSSETEVTIEGMRPTTESTEQEDEDYNAENLISKYCNGLWDGSFISNSSHCASIEDGVLWIDCTETHKIPDMGKYIENYGECKVLEYTDQGTWLHNILNGSIEFWTKGELKERILLHSKYYQASEVYKLENCFVERYEQYIWIHKDETVEKIEGIVDCYESNGIVLFSNYAHENYAISPNGNVEKISSTYVRFPRKQEQITYITDEHLLKLLDEYDMFMKPFSKIGNDFLKVTAGNIIYNNKVVGHTSLGRECTAEQGPNLKFYYSNISYYFDGSQMVRIYKDYKDFTDVPDGEVCIEWIGEKGIVFQVYGEEANTICIIRYDDDKLQIVSENVLDCNVAYDTLYYMEGNTVYALEWYNPQSNPEIYFEGAYAIAQHADEREGAIVPTEKANWDEYGYENLYSPYGSNKK